MHQNLNNVLLIDDDPDDAFLMERALNEIGGDFQFHHVDNCDEVLPALALHRPGIIFIDINMPKRNGLECLHDWRGEAFMQEIPVVVYSSSEQAMSIAQAYSRGAALYFRKPATFSGLVAALRTILAYDWSDPAGIRAQQLVNGQFLPFQPA